MEPQQKCDGLSLSEICHETLLEDGDRIVLVLDGDGMVVEAGIAARRLLEGGDGLVGIHIGAILEEGDSPGKFAQAFGVAVELSGTRDLLPEGHPIVVSPITLQARTRDGSGISLSFKLRYSPTDGLWLLWGTRVSPSAMKSAREESSTRSESRYCLSPRFDVSRTAEPIMISDARTRTVIVVSPGFERLFGWTSEELRGNSTSSIYMDRAYFKKIGKMAEEAYQKQGFFAGTVQVLRKDGKAMQCSFLNMPLYDAQTEEPRWLVTLVDEHIREWKRQQDMERLAKAARDLADDLSQVSGESVAIWNSIVSLSGLSSREKDVVSLVKEGASTKQIAERLGLKESTVKNHLSMAYKKIGVKSRTELVWKLNQKP